MADETVGVNDAVAEELQVNSEESATAEPQDGGEDTEPQESQEQGEPKHKKLGGWQRKQLKAEAERDYWREVALGNLQAKPKEEAKPVQEEQEPDPDKFESTFEYLKAVRAYDRAQVLKEFEAKQAAKEQERTQRTTEQAQIEAWNKSRAEAVSRYEDLEVVLNNPDVPCTKVMSKFLMKNAENGSAIDVAYYLGTHPEEAQRIAAMESVEDVFEALGEIKATVRAQFAKQPTAQVEKPAVTKALPPPKPVQKTQATKTVDVHDPDLPYAEYVKARERQEAAKRGK